jgi:hypothetical protein
MWRRLVRLAYRGSMARPRVLLAEDHPRVAERLRRLLERAGALDEATQKGWTLVDIKQDWKVVYPFQK